MSPHASVLRLKRCLSFRLSVLFLWFLFVPNSVSACQCSGFGPTPCQAIGPHSAVFLGVVDHIETPSAFGFLKAVKIHSWLSFREQYMMYSDNVTVVLNVEEWFSGQPDKTARLHIGRFPGACGYEYRPGDLFFHRGERYLVYATEKGGILSTNHCSKTRHAPEKNDAELETLRRLHGLPLPIITGSYLVPSGNDPSTPSVGRTSVTVTSPDGRQFTTETDAEGRFTFSGLPPATYKIQFATPPGYVVGWSTSDVSFTKEGMGMWKGMVPLNQRELVVSADACRDASYEALPNGRISGVAAGPRGKLPNPIWLRLWRANHIDPSKIPAGVETKAVPSGAFQFGPLLPGSYVIGTYLDPADYKERVKGENYSEHFDPQPWFYPGTTDPTKAKPIKVGFAQEVSGIHFVVPLASVKARAQR